MHVLPPVRACRATDVVEDLVARGLSLIRCDRNDLLRLAGELGRIVPHRHSGIDGVTTIARDDRRTRRPGRAGFTADALPPHTDGSDAARPPELLLMTCDIAATTGGECVVVDGHAVYLDLARTDPDGFHLLSTPRSATFGADRLRSGAVFESLDGGGTGIRLRLDDLVRFARDVQPHVPELRACIARHAVVIALPAGRGYVLDNRRWLHGRLAFTGTRRMYRLHVRPSRHRGIPIGFRITDPSSSGNLSGPL